MNLEAIALGIAGVLFVLLIVLVVNRKRPKKLQTNQYTAKWRELQGLCADKATWPVAIQEADKLLDAALKRRRFKGKSMGERMVAANKKFTDNDSVWSAHNLSKKTLENPKSRLKEKEVKNALIGIRQALKDLGAL